CGTTTCTTTASRTAPPTVCSRWSAAASCSRRRDAPSRAPASPAPVDRAHPVAVGVGEPALEQLEPVLDLAIALDRAVATPRRVPRARLPALPRQRRVPREAPPRPRRARRRRLGIGDREDDEDAVRAGLEAGVALHRERREHEFVQRLQGGARFLARVRVELVAG